MNKIKNRLIAAVCGICFLLSPVVMTGSSYALFEGSVDQAQCGANLENGTVAGCTDNTNSSQEATDTISAAIGLLSFIVGIASVVMLIIAGFKFITSQGDAGSIKTARNTALYAIIGLVLAAIAQGVVKFVLVKL